MEGKVWKRKRKKCKVCGKEIIILNKYDGSTKYCDKCKNEKQLQWNREYKKKLKNK